MTKSKHQYVQGKIPLSEVYNFINPVKVNIDIPYSDFCNILNCPTDDFYNQIDPIFSEYLDNLPTLKNAFPGGLKECYRYICGITYNTHINGYDFRINPIYLINNMFKCMKLDYEIPFINLDTPNGISYFKDYVITYINTAKKSVSNYKKIAVLNEMNENIDKLINIYNYDIDSVMKKYLLPKDALFYLAYNSLFKYKETNNSAYMIFPYEYFVNVSHMDTSEYPHKINLFNGPSRIWWNDFRFEYARKIGLDFIPDNSNLLLSNKEVLFGWEILKPGYIDTTIRNEIEKRSFENGINYEYYRRLFEMKMNFYMNSGFIYQIIGKYGLNGYVGFTYDNEYLLFDKFHNSENVEPLKKTILTHEEAVFALPSDRFSIIKQSKRYVLGERKKDSRILKYNHTINGSFIDRLDKVIKSPNVSTSTFEEELEKEKSKVLIKIN